MNEQKMQIMLAQRKGKTRFAAMAFAAYASRMKPGQKAALISRDDITIITRNPDHIGYEPTIKLDKHYLPDNLQLDKQK